MKKYMDKDGKMKKQKVTKVTFKNKHGVEKTSDDI